MNALYVVYRLYVNHFLPVTKLQQKVRVKQVYDVPKTPNQRVVDSPEVSESTKAKLHAEHATLDVVKLKQPIDRMSAALFSE